MTTAGLWPLTTLCFLAALSLLGAASGIEDAFPEDQVAEFLQSSVDWALKACLLVPRFGAHFSCVHVVCAPCSLPLFPSPAMGERRCHRRHF